MARFGVYRLTDGGLVLDCQADFLADIGTRFVIPLLPQGEGPPPNPRINPVFDIQGEQLVLVTQFASAVRTSELRVHIASLDHDHIRVVNAIDALIGTN